MWLCLNVGLNCSWSGSLKISPGNSLSKSTDSYGSHASYDEAVFSEYFSDDGTPNVGRIMIDARLSQFVQRRGD